MTIIRELIDDLSGPNVLEIIARPDFTVEDFEYMIKDLTCSLLFIYQEYSKKVPFEYVLKNLDKPWSWFELSRNKNLTYDIFLTLKHKKWSLIMLRKNQNFNKSRSIKILKNIFKYHKLPHELINIVADYQIPILEPITI